MALATRLELLATEDISSYEDTINITLELQRSESAILRLLNTIWWQKFLQNNPQYTPGPLRLDLLDKEQWRQPVIDYTLAYKILPKLGSAFNSLRAQYHNSWEHNIRTLLHEGIHYDTEGTTLRFLEEDAETNYIRLRT